MSRKLTAGVSGSRTHCVEPVIEQSSSGGIARGCKVMPLCALFNRCSRTQKHSRGNYSHTSLCEVMMNNFVSRTTPALPVTSSNVRSAWVSDSGRSWKLFDLNKNSQTVVLYVCLAMALSECTTYTHRCGWEFHKRLRMPHLHHCIHL